ncbi:hypothetical protein [Sphingobacterium sp. JB170]|uniref:hypothetical protein n=1 Tax=Sphingobacterium sp. JB170 TaxID=1434842 RepID=UPI00097E92EE|nr:hypothetical protein [Sphingobacterium sp. JB170]SJN47545.1 similar to glycosyltransferase [Sphingobacterium sp. JB170]
MKPEPSTKRLALFFEQHPALDISYLERLSSPTGIYQHGSFNIPNYHHGYCLDDNSRALLLLVKAEGISTSFLNHPLLSTYLSFIFFAQNEDGTFKNFMSFDLKFLENKGSEDSTGRAIWAIGSLLGNAHFESYHSISREIFDRSLDRLLDFRSPRAVGYCLLGILKFIEANPLDSHARNVAHALADFLEAEFDACDGHNWPWFEEIISYDNAILPLAMLRAGRIMKNQRWTEIGFTAFTFLDTVLFSNGQLSMIGNQGWYPKGGEVSRSGQQPIEVPSIMLLYRELYRLESNPIHLAKMQRAFLWYLGENDQELSVFNPSQKSCYDGLEEYGVNKNQGAESNIAFWTAYILAKGIDTLCADCSVKTKAIINKPL